MLFLFLGLPGAVLAALLTATVASAGAPRRRASRPCCAPAAPSAAQLIRLAGAEAAVIGLAGSVVGLAGAALVGQIAFGTASFGATAGAAVGWAGAAAAVGLAIAGAADPAAGPAGPARATVAAGRASVAVRGTRRGPATASTRRLLIVAGLVFNATSRNGYQLVLAPEGVPTISVSYWALAGPALLWLGAGLLAWRLADLLLGRGRPVLAALRPLAGGLAGPVPPGMSRQRRPLARAIVLLALAIAFAVSTATFNATYAQQAEADAQLTNGADVTVTQSPGARRRPGTRRDRRGPRGPGGRTAAAPLRLHRHRPAGPLRGPARHHHLGHRAAGHLLRRRHRRRLDAHPCRPTGLDPGRPPKPSRTTNCSSATRSTCGWSTAAPTN